MRISIIGLVASFSLMSLPALAQTFDGSQPLLCAPMEIYECDSGADCRRVTAESINAPEFLRVNVAEKQLTGTRGGVENRPAQIEHIERVDNKLVLQGVEDGYEDVRDGLGWTLAIMQDTGRMVLTASGDNAGFVAFGSCMPL